MTDMTLTTLTPLWTGGVDGMCERVYESGLLGSLRWWYEAVVRGLGGKACDPIGGGCIYERKQGESHEQAYARLCDACRLFGCTGWRRRFRLEVQAEGELAWEGGQPLKVRPYGRQRGWYLPPGWLGQMHLRLIGEPQALAQMVGLLRFLEKWGAIGARPQLGYGVFRIKKITGEPPRHWEWQVLGAEKAGPLPDLRTFTFFRLQFEPREETWWAEVDGIKQLRSRRKEWAVLEHLTAKDMVPVIPALKNHLRYGLDWSSGFLTQWLFGTIRPDERRRGKLGLSWAYRQGDEWQVRGWVHIPQDRTGQRARNEITGKLSDVLKEPHGWFKAMGVTGYRFPAQVEVAPREFAWRIGDAGRVAALLEKVTGESK